MPSSPIRMTLRWTVPHGQTHAITTAVQDMMMAARSKPGCLGCSLSTEVGERTTLRYAEDWDTEEHLRHEVQEERFARLAGLLDAATEHPNVEFALPTGIRGLDYAEEVRGLADPRGNGRR